MHTQYLCCALSLLFFDVIHQINYTTAAENRAPITVQDDSHWDCWEHIVVLQNYSLGVNTM